MSRVVRMAKDPAARSYLHLWCPACQDRHTIVYRRADAGDIWIWDGKLETPTISPSILVTGTQHPEGDPFHAPAHQVAPGSRTRCHSFVRNGQWRFLDDCTHTLAGQTVPMVPVDQWPA